QQQPAAVEDKRVARRGRAAADGERLPRGTAEPAVRAGRDAADEALPRRVRAPRADHVEQGGAGLVVREGGGEHGGAAGTGGGGAGPRGPVRRATTEARSCSKSRAAAGPALTASGRKYRSAAPSANVTSNSASSARDGKSPLSASRTESTRRALPPNQRCAW